MTFEKELAKAKNTTVEVKKVLNGLRLSEDDWSTVVAGMIHQGIEHHESVMYLIQSGRTGSAFALCRSIAEILVRGAWFTCCATKQQVAKFMQHDRINLTFDDMAKEIDQSQQTQFFHDFKQKYWQILSSYAHTGALQLDRRWTEGKLAPAYENDEIAEVISISTICILLLVQPYLAKNGHSEGSKKIVELGQYWKQRMSQDP